MAFVMSPVVRALLWVVAILAPGGFLLLPVLAADTLRKRRGVTLVPAVVPVTAGGLERVL